MRIMDTHSGCSHGIRSIIRRGLCMPLIVAHSLPDLHHHPQPHFLHLPQVHLDRPPKKKEKLFDYIPRMGTP